MHAGRTVAAREGVLGSGIFFEFVTGIQQRVFLVRLGVLQRVHSFLGRLVGFGGGCDHGSQEDGDADASQQRDKLVSRENRSNGIRLGFQSSV